MRPSVRYLGLTILVLAFSFSTSYSQSDVGSASGQIEKLASEGDSLRRGGDFAASIQVYERLLPLLMADSLADERELYLIRVGLSHSRSDHWQEALDLFEQVKVSSITHADTSSSFYGHAFHNSGNVYRKTGQFGKALREYQKAEKVYVSAGDSAMCNLSRMTMAIIYQERAEYKEALDRYIQAALSFEAMGDSLRLGEVYSGIGNVQESMGHLSRAEEYYRKSLEIRTDILDVDGLASTHNNLGTLLRKEGQFDSSVVHLQSAIHFMELRPSSNLGRAYQNLAKTLEEKGEFELAVATYLNAVYERYSAGDTLGYIVTLSELSSLYTDLDSTQRADEMLSRAEAFLAMQSTDEVRMEFLDAKSTYYLSIDRLDSALICIAEKENLREAIDQQLYLEEVAHIQEKYESKRKDEELVNLNEIYRSTSKNLIRKEEEVSRLNTLLLMSGLLFILGVLAVVFIIRHRKRVGELRVLQAAIDGEEKEKHRIARELHDSAGNTLRIAKSNLNSIAERVHDVDIERSLLQVREKVEEVTKQVIDISHIMAPPSFGDSSYVNSIRFLVVDMVDEREYEVNFEMDKDDPWDELKDETKANIYRIIQEAIMNILRHANAHTISLVGKMTDSMGQFLIQDDGRNDGDPETKGGIGLQNMRERASVIFGDLQFRKRNGNTGMEIFLSFPLRQNRAI